MGVMKLKQTDTNDNGLRDIWNMREFARRDLLDKQHQSRLKMLMGPMEERQDAVTDRTSRWW
jgi:hypothetical protein